jgi:hypothetical protein
MKRYTVLLGLWCLVFGVAGCVSTVDGHHQGGVPFVKDKAVGRYERPLDDVMKAARATISYNGVLTVENVVGKTLEGRVDKRTVWIALEAVTPVVTQVTVQVRTSGGGTDMELASYLKEQIAVRLVAGNSIPSAPPTPPATNSPAR